MKKSESTNQKIGTNPMNKKFTLINSDLNYGQHNDHIEILGLCKGEILENSNVVGEYSTLEVHENIYDWCPILEEEELCDIKKYIILNIYSVTKELALNKKLFKKILKCAIIRGQFKLMIKFWDTNKPNATAPKFQDELFFSLN